MLENLPSQDGKTACCVIPSGTHVVLGGCSWICRSVSSRKAYGIPLSPNSRAQPVNPPISHRWSNVWTIRLMRTWLTSSIESVQCDQLLLGLNWFASKPSRTVSPTIYDEEWYRSSHWQCDCTLWVRSGGKKRSLKVDSPALIVRLHTPEVREIKPFDHLRNLIQTIHPGTWMRIKKLSQAPRILLLVGPWAIPSLRLGYHYIICKFNHEMKCHAWTVGTVITSREIPSSFKLSHGEGNGQGKQPMFSDQKTIITTALPVVIDKIMPRKYLRSMANPKAIGNALQYNKEERTSVLSKF